MFARKSFAAAVVALGTLAAVPAQAGNVQVQFDFGRPGYGWQGGHGWGNHGPSRHFLSPREVRRELRQRGYGEIRYLDRRGAVYQVRAERRGRDFFLVVSARTGDIISRHRI